MCLGPYGGPRGVAVSYERGTPVQAAARSSRACCERSEKTVGRARCACTLRIYISFYLQLSARPRCASRQSVRCGPCCERSEKTVVRARGACTLRTYVWFIYSCRDLVACPSRESVGRGRCWSPQALRISISFIYRCRRDLVACPSRESVAHARVSGGGKPS